MNAHPQAALPVADLRHARVGDALVDFTANRIQRDGADLRITPKAMAVLRELVVRAAQVVKRDELLAVVWRDGFPTDDVLTHAVTELRRALEIDPRAPQWIETVPRLGYRLIAPVEILDRAPRASIESQEFPPAPPIADEIVARRTAVVPSRTIVVAALLIVVTASAAAAWLWSRNRASPPMQAAAITTPETVDPSAPLASNLRALTTDPDREQFPSISPDGARLVYVAGESGHDGTQLLVGSVDLASPPVVLSRSPSNARDDYPVWSPDGTRIAFLRFRQDACEIRIVPALGGNSRRVGVCRPRMVDYVDWSPDGRAILMTRWRERTTVSPSVAVVHRLDLATGELREMPYEASTTDSDIQPRASPDARWLAFRRGAAPYSDLWVAPYTGGSPKRLTTLKSRMRGFAWYPDSQHLLLSSDHEGRQALYRVSIADGSVEALDVFDAHFPSIALHRPIAVFQQETMLDQLVEVELAGDEPAHPVAASTRSDYSPSYSPDGSKLAFVSVRSGEPQLWIHDFATRTAHQVTRHHRAEISLPRWSPDGARLLHVVRGDGHSRLAIVEVETGRVSYVGADTENMRFGSWSRDGAFIDFASDRGGRWQPWRLSTTGGEARRLSESEAMDPQDPLGDGFVYFTRENDRGLFRVSLADGEVERVSDAIGYFNMGGWELRADGLYYIDTRGENLGSALFRVTIDTDKPGVPEMLHATVGVEINQMSLSPDASRVVTVRSARDETNLMAVDLRLR